MKREEVIFNIHSMLALVIYFSYLCFINTAIVAINLDFSMPFIEFVISLGFASIITSTLVIIR